MKPVFSLEEISPQIGNSEIRELEMSITAAQVGGRMVRHRHGLLDLICMPSGKLMRTPDSIKNKQEEVETCVKCGK